jgi:hypothetical protein
LVGVTVKVDRELKARLEAVVGTIPGIALPSARRAAFLRQAIERAVEAAEKSPAPVKVRPTGAVPLPKEPR